MAGIEDLLTTENIESSLNFLKDNQKIVRKITDKNILPSSYNLFLRSLSGINDPIDESFFKESELEELRKKIARTEIAVESNDKSYWQAPNTISYYGGDMTGLRALFNPEANMEMTIGSATYDKDKEGTYTLKDRYNFNNKHAAIFEQEEIKDLTDKEILQKTIDLYKNKEVPLAAVARVLGGINLSGGPKDQKGTDINLNLGKITSQDKQNIVDQEIKDMNYKKRIKEFYNMAEDLDNFEKDPESGSKELKKRFKVSKLLDSEGDLTLSEFVQQQKEYPLEEIQKIISSSNSMFGSYSPYEEVGSFFKGGLVDKPLPGRSRDI